MIEMIVTSNEKAILERFDDILFYSKADINNEDIKNIIISIKEFVKKYKLDTDQHDFIDYSKLIVRG